MNAHQVIGQQRQDILCVCVPWVYSDLDTTTQLPMFDLPKGAIVIGGGIIVKVVTNAANLTLGSVANPDSLVEAVSSAATGLKANDGADIILGPLAAGATYGLKASAELTEGSGLVVCYYIVEGRSCLTQG